MRQVFRITFEQKDYLVKLINALPIDRHTVYFDIIIEHVSYRLIKGDGNWHLENVEDTKLNNLAIAIGKVISLRYRI